MDCEGYRAAASARLDGEAPGIAGHGLDAHLRRCAACAAFEADAAAVMGRTRVAGTPDVPDLRRAVVRSNAAADRLASFGVARGLLTVVALQIVVLSLPDLFLVGTDGPEVHSGRHLGAFQLAYAMGLLVVVARPARARTMLGVAAVLGVSMAITATVDVVQGRVPLVGEAAHLPELISVVLLWLIARPRIASPDPGPGGGAGTSRTLKAVPPPCPDA